MADPLDPRVRFRLQNEFVQLYGSRAASALEAYAQGGDPVAVLGAVPHGMTAIRPDMAVRTYTRAAAAAALDGTRPGVRSLMAQFDGLDPQRQAILGVAFPDGDALTFVVEVRRAAR